MKKYLLGIMTFALLLLVACADSGNRFDLTEGEIITIHQSGDEMIYDSVDEMLKAMSSSGVWRSEVVRVEVLDERTELVNVNAAWQHEDAPSYSLYDGSPLYYPDRYEPRIFHRVQVLETFKGESEIGNILEVRQVGGQIDDVRMDCESFQPFAPGDDLILFLVSPVWMPNSPAVLMSTMQAAYRFPDLSSDADRVHSDESLESFYQFTDNIAEYALTLTFEDLANFQIENFGQVSDSFDAILR